MKIAIIGSRSFNQYDLLNDFLLKRISINQVTVIISGGANGADKLGEAFAKEHNKEMCIFLPDWNKYNKKAGIIRNGIIIQNSDIVFAFWDGNSPGTKNSIDRCIKQGKKCYVYNYITNLETNHCIHRGIDDSFFN